jgi:hypothetical protein
MQVQNTRIFLIFFLGGGIFFFLFVHYSALLHLPLDLIRNKISSATRSHPQLDLIRIHGFFYAHANFPPDFTKLQGNVLVLKLPNAPFYKGQTAVLVSGTVGSN